MPYWEPGPWTVKIGRNTLGRVDSCQIVSPRQRCTTVEVIGVKRNRAGMIIDPDIQAAVVCQCRVQPKVICDCGVTYAGLDARTLTGNADLLGAAPDLYAALDLLLFDVQRHNYYHATPDGIIMRAENALAKARGEVDAE